jgi:hypothetical protein
MTFLQEREDVFEEGGHMQTEVDTGAHFQYKELLKRLSDITNSSSMERNGSGVAQSGKRKSRTKANLDKTDKREPLKEKT